MILWKNFEDDSVPPDVRCLGNSLGGILFPE